MKRVLISFLFVAAIAFIFELPVSASVVDSPTDTIDSVVSGEEDVDEEDVDDKEDGEESENSNGVTSTELDFRDASSLPVVTTDDAMGWIKKKGNDLINLVQTGALYIVVVFFFIAAVCVILSAIGAVPRGIGAGAVIICIGVFILVYAGPSILTSITSWALN